MLQTASFILMVRPAGFGYNAETADNNTFQHNETSISATNISKKAVEEFDAFVKLLREKNIDVTVVEDSATPVKPDAVFPNNWFCTLPDGKLIVFPMFAANRREEKRDDILQQITHDFSVSDVEDWSEYEADNFFLEGTGSMIFDHANKTVYACISPRTHKALFERFAKTHHYKPIIFSAKDENDVPIYHTNVMMHIGESYAVVCLDAIKNETEKIYIAQTLREAGHEIIPISFEQMNAFAGNMIQVRNKFGEPFTILSKTGFDSLTLEQKYILSVHTNLLPVNISTIETIGGGSARCMIAEIFLERKMF
ncbi:amidinotransferase [Arachidicoccus ginsenosidimutans]|uniref:citrulline utilization hydrolase CtlX n=1 Tax=Arachidicoccus sp. BS20 TaxID=1850526 RepID=UPI0007F0DCD7|nr:arginine deiminase-related protein [Arachidicoccus sp. BS20]ANI89714.1 amidinotransferase [Arachidicoccus sp. BS20]